MSIQALSWSVKKNCDNTTTKLVLILLANYADEKNSCYPSEKHLAKLAGVTDRTIRRSLKWLNENAYLDIIHVKGTSNRYILRVDASVHTTQEVDVLTLRTPMSTNTKDKTKDKTDFSKFDEFWDFYPRKVSKHQARKVFGKIDDKHYEKIIKATEVFAHANINTEEKFIPHPATFLNQRRYEDFLDINKYKNKGQSLNNLAG